MTALSAITPHNCAAHATLGKPSRLKGISCNISAHTERGHCMGIVGVNRIYFWPFLLSFAVLLASLADV